VTQENIVENIVEWELSRQDTMRLLAFVCSFAWADHEIQEEERHFVRDLVSTLELEDEDVEQVQLWLKLPPRPEEIDPQMVPPEHRELFVAVAKMMVGADGIVAESEADTLALFQELLS
jgi:uncharacterized tellurite resistance protein B-like protein